MLEKYFNRELSWLSFNELVLSQIADYSLPLYERIKFLAIYTSNTDEFYRVRIAAVRSLIAVFKENKKEKDNLDFSPKKVLDDIKKEISKQQKKFEHHLYKVIIPELSENNVILYRNEKLEKEHEDFLESYFMDEILPEIQPVLLSESGGMRSFLQDNVIYLAIKLFKNKKKEDISYAVIKIPRQLSRFVELPKLDSKYLIFFVEDIIRHNLKFLFPGYDIDSSFSIKVSRNADLSVEDEFSGDLLEKLKKSLKKRKTGTPARFKYDRETPKDLLEVLRLSFKISEKDFAEGSRYLNLNDFFYFPNPIGKKYELKHYEQLNHPIFEKYNSILKAIRHQDIMLHFPYHTYNYVLRFFHEAALDPKVEEIKTTQYRVAKNSTIVNALITAAKNGKKVTVFIEVKARFDEESNINFAKQMRAAGINVIASIPGLKVHAKAALVVRKSTTESSGKKAYAFLSTGNFNEKTAKQYADEGFFTSNKKIIKDLQKLFLYLENTSSDFKFKNILVPRFNMKNVLSEKINREVENAKAGKKAYLIFKMNNLEEKEMIDAFYNASESGVNIDLIIRGICCLKPDMPFSKNIKVTRIVDRYLEHSRIFAFYNEGDWEVYISSADLMNRNLHRRVEAAVPILNKQIKNEIIDILKIQLKDNTKAKFINSEGTNIDKTKKEGEEAFRAQVDTYIYLQKKLMMEG